MALSVPDRIIIADEVLIEPDFHRAFYAISNQNGTKLETTYNVLTWDSPVYVDTGFTESGGEVTVLEDLDNARARIDFAVSMANARPRWCEWLFTCKGSSELWRNRCQC
jgi:hypothetical protein